MKVLAQINEMLNPATAPVAKNFQVHLTDVFLLLAAILAVTLALLLWAKYMRKGRKADRHTRVLDPTPRPAEEPDRAERSHHRRHRRKRKRPRFTDRKPTLSETGGLPPLRPERPTPLPPPQ